MATARRTQSSGRGASRLTLVLLLLVLAWLILYPLGALVVRSLTGPEGGFTLEAYRSVYVSRQTWNAALNTVIVVVGATLFSVVVGTGLAWLLTRTTLPLGRFLRPIPMLPLLLPPLLGAAGWIFLLAPRAGFLNVAIRSVTGMEADTGPLNIYSVWGIVIVVSLYCVPYVYALVQPALMQMDSALEEAAHISGANRWRQTLDITLPVVKPAVIAGALFAMIVSASEFTIPVLIGTGARVEVLSTLLYGHVSKFPIQFERGAALAMLLLAAVGIATFYQRRLLRSDRYTTVTGKASVRAKVDLGPWRVPALLCVLGYVGLTLILPLAAIVIVSVSPFWTARPSLSGLTLDHFRFVLFEHHGTVRTILNSTLLAFSGASIATLLGVLVAYVTLAWRTRLGSALDTIANISLGIPAIVFGVGVLFAFIRPPFVLYGTLLALLVAYVAKLLPIALRPIANSYGQLSRGIVEASWVTGGRQYATLWYVVAPLVKSGMFSAWALTFVLLLREMPMSVLLSTPNTPVISVELFNFWEGRTVPVVAAFSMIVFAVGALGLVVIALAAKVMNVDWRPGESRSGARER